MCTAVHIRVNCFTCDNVFNLERCEVQLYVIPSGDDNRSFSNFLLSSLTFIITKKRKWNDDNIRFGFTCIEKYENFPKPKWLHEHFDNRHDGDMMGPVL